MFGALSVQIAGFGVALGLGATTGVFLARKQLNKMDTQGFRRYRLVLMFFSGIAMLYRAI